MNFPGFIRITNLEDCTGKTIAGSGGDSGQLGFRFTDGTYFFAETKDERDELDTKYSDIENHVALEMGLIDQTEYDRRKAADDEIRGQSERSEYERLRAKFEPDAGKEPLSHDCPQPR